MAQKKPDAEAFLPLSHIVFHVLASLAGGRQHGYGIIKDVEARTGGRIELEAGTLYAAIKRLRESALIEEARGPADSDPRRRYYSLTSLGRRVLRAEAQRLAELVDLAREIRVLPPILDAGG